MSDKRILTIIDWLGTGKGDINFEVGTFILIEQTSGGRKISRLVVQRKPDQYSSRLGMMAYLNKRNRSLAWGFGRMTLTVERFSDQGSLETYKIITFTGVAVEKVQMSGEEEEVTLVFNQQDKFCIGQC